MTTVIALPATQSPTQRVAAEIRAEMARRRVTQAAIGRALNLGQSAISRRLTGEVPFDANELAVVASMLAVSVGYLFGETTHREPGTPGPAASSGWRSRTKIVKFPRPDLTGLPQVA